MTQPGSFLALRAALVLYALGAIVTASIAMWSMVDARSSAGRGIRSLVKAYPHPLQLAVVFVGLTVIWPYLWFAALRGAE